MRSVLRQAVLSLALVAAQPAHPQDETKEERLVLPSGLNASLHEMLWDRPGGGLIYRFRFVSTDFTGQEPFESLTGDLEYLCNSYALPRLAGTGPAPSRIVVSLADKPSPFGEFDPAVVQIFESFSVEGGACIWEMF